MDLVTDGALTNNTQRMAAAAYAAGVLNEDQQSILDEATTA
jgi:hypothetical protein